MIENVEDLSSELEVPALTEWELAIQDEIELAEAGTSEPIALHISICAGQWSGECRRVKEVPIVPEVRIRIGNEIGPACLS